MNAVRSVLQLGVVLGLFAAVATLSDWPSYRSIPQGHGLVTLTFVHSASRRGDCRRLTAEEQRKLPPNMRRVEDCPRGRRPVHVEFDVDGRSLLRGSLPPTGIAGDGPSRIYRKFVLAAGEHELAIRLRDGGSLDHAEHRRVTLAADQSFVIDFNSETGRFVYR